jgi:protein CpxP
MKHTIPALLIGLAVLLPTLALAQPEGKDGPDDCAQPEHRRVHPDFDLMASAPLPPFLHGIALSETQKDAIFGILHTDAPAIRTRMKAARQAREALQA